jgi:hypothetical protein
VRRRAARRGRAHANGNISHAELREHDEREPRTLRPAGDDGNETQGALFVQRGCEEERLQVVHIVRGSGDEDDAAVERRAAAGDAVGFTLKSWFSMWLVYKKNYTIFQLESFRPTLSSSAGGLAILGHFRDFAVSLACAFFCFFAEIYLCGGQLVRIGEAPAPKLIGACTGLFACTCK